jgi:hypothetical protein
MGLLVAGVVLASLFGARNGDAFSAYRASVAVEQPAELPGPSERLTGWLSVGGVGWGFGVALVVVGAVLARRQQAEDAAGGTGGERADFGVSMQQVLAELDAIGALVAELPMDTDQPEARERIDALGTDVLLPVVDARYQFIARHGLGTFTEYFSPFSAGERNLARCWSAITDGHSVVAREALQRSRASFEEAAQRWAAAEASS